MKNKLSDLNNHLFEQLERLNDEDLKGDKLQEEIQRSKALTNVGQTIINNGTLILNAKKHFDEYGYQKGTELFQIETSRNEDTNGQA